MNPTSGFAAPARAGERVEGCTVVIPVTRNLVFTQGIVSADGRPVARINGISKRGGPMPELQNPIDLGPMFGMP